MIVQRTELLILQCYRYVSTVQKACCHWWHRKQRSGISWQIGLSGVMRGLFANGTGLNNSINSNFHPVEQFVLYRCGSYLADYVRWYGPSPFDSIAIAADLGIVQSSIDPIVWAVGVLRDPLIQFTDSQGEIQELNAFYRSNISSLPTIVNVRSTVCVWKTFSNKKEYLLIGTDHRYPW